MLGPYLGEITIFAGDFPPMGWAFCDGQLLAIADYTALYSVLGTTYGGDGDNTFALPDIRSRSPIHPGQAPGLTFHALGEMGGQEQVTLAPWQMPAHNHGLLAYNGSGNSTVAAGNSFAEIKDATDISLPSYSTELPANAMQYQSITANGSNQPFDIVHPFLAVRFIICIEGIVPT